MNLTQYSEFPPADFVAFLAQREGLSQEAAEDRLERWLNEYHAHAGDGGDRKRPLRSGRLPR